MEFKKISIFHFLFFTGQLLFAQQTMIKGFADVNALYVDSNSNTSFNLGEFDLFITSEMSDKISFLGESVFKYDAVPNSKFSIGVERIIIKLNYFRNHNFLIGKHHTPVNYWNDSYHHGRVFFPTVLRPQLFNSAIIPLHTTGISFQGINLTALKFGYDLMVGNGIGATDISDNDKSKSVILAVHAKPFDGMRIGISYYYDDIASGVKKAGGSTITASNVIQSLYSGSIAYFKTNVEFLSELTYANNKVVYQNAHTTLGYYVYAGYRYKKVVLYGRFDQNNYEDGEPYFGGSDVSIITGGLRYEMNYLAVVKAEYQNVENKGITSGFINVQIAVGF